MVSGWQPGGAAEVDGSTAAGGVVGLGEGVVGLGACVVGAGARVVGAGEVATAAACVALGCAGDAAAVAFVAWWLGVPVAVAAAVAVRPAGVPLGGEEDGPPDRAAAMMMISATTARSPVSALWRAGQDAPRCGGRRGGWYGPCGW